MSEINSKVALPQTGFFLSFSIEAWPNKPGRPGLSGTVPTTSRGGRRRPSGKGARFPDRSREAYGRTGIAGREAVRLGGIAPAVG
jgi:hypothetical protein